MTEFYQLMVDMCTPFVVGTVVLCVLDWVVVMFKRIFS